MPEIWSEDGRRIEVKMETGHPAEWSGDAIPEMVRRETFDAWAWRYAVRSKDGMGEHRPGPDSGTRFSTREAALGDLLEVLRGNPDLDGLPIVDWATGESLEEEEPH